METLLRNARYGVRVLLRAPAFTVVAVLTLALGIGANAAVFSIVNALLIRPLPLPASDRLVSVLGVDKDGERQYLSMPDFEDLRAQARLVEGLSGFVPQSANLTGRAEPQRVRAGVRLRQLLRRRGRAACDRPRLPGRRGRRGRRAAGLRPAARDLAEPLRRRGGSSSAARSSSTTSPSP